MGTKNRKAVLGLEARKNLSNYLYTYAKEKGIFMHINYVNADHVHTLIDLPASYAQKDVAKLLKGSSSFWINKNRLTKLKFSWARGYGAFSVSASAIEKLNPIFVIRKNITVRSLSQKSLRYFFLLMGWRCKTVKTVCSFV